LSNRTYKALAAQNGINATGSTNTAGSNAAKPGASSRGFPRQDAKPGATTASFQRQDAKPGASSGSFQRKTQNLEQALAHSTGKMAKDDEGSFNKPDLSAKPGLAQQSSGSYVKPDLAKPPTSAGAGVSGQLNSTRAGAPPAALPAARQQQQP